MYQHIRVPTSRREDHRQPGFLAERSRQPDHSLHRRGRNRRGHHAGHAQGGGCGRERRLWRASARSTGWRCTAGEKSCQVYGENVWLPDETLQAAREFVVSIKGPLTTPVGGGIRSINVALRQELDLYVCLRPVRYFKGVPSPLKQPEKTDMVIFRENSEDIYAGIEWEAETDGAQQGDRFPDRGNGREEDPLPADLRASASSRCRAKEPSGWCARPSSMRSPTSAGR